MINQSQSSEPVSQSVIFRWTRTAGWSWTRAPWLHPLYLGLRCSRAQSAFAAVFYH